MLFIPDEQRASWADWDFSGPRHPCFLCGHPVGEGRVGVWAGSAGSVDQVALTSNEQASAWMGALTRGGPVTAAGYIFLHPDCVPGFSRRLLQDFEASQLEPIRLSPAIDDRRAPGDS